MADTAKLTLMPLGIELDVHKGTPLREVLFKWGVEFPCAGRRTCKRCRVKLLQGDLPVDDPNYGLEPEELEAGIRLACAHCIQDDLVLEVIQWEATILTDDTQFTFVPQPGLGIAVDLGTTTVAAQLLDLQTGQVLNVQTGLNAQSEHGADIMSRISFAIENGGQTKLQQAVREQIGGLVDALLEHSGGRDVRQVVIVGNTPMHNLFCGIDVTPLSFYPFNAGDDGLKTFVAPALGWEIPGDPEVHFLPGLGSFVGSDILAGIIATGFHHTTGLKVFVDLGTNGEMIVGNRDRMLCASTAAGPAFEAATISQGMQATTGAISEVVRRGNALQCFVLGKTEARGVCGSGLVDAVAAGLDLGWINSMGRLVGREDIPLQDDIRLSAKDVRELQLAKGAIAVGIRLLVEQLGAQCGDIEEVLVAGAFGNYIRMSSALRIGLFSCGEGNIRTVGNTALLGAKVALFNGGDISRIYQEILAKIEHVSLNTDPKFQDYYVDELMFPDA